MSIEWETPPAFFEALNNEFHITVDVCAQPYNAKVPHYFTPEIDGLSQEWRGVCWMNPPYNQGIGKWIEKAYKTAQKGHTVIALLQARSSETKTFHNYIMKASEIRFVRDRLYFGNVGKFSRANHGSMVVVFLPYCSGPPVISSMGNYHVKKASNTI